MDAFIEFKNAIADLWPGYAKRLTDRMLLVVSQWQDRLSGLPLHALVTHLTEQRMELPDATKPDWTDFRRRIYRTNRAGAQRLSDRLSKLRESWAQTDPRHAQRYRALDDAGTWDALMRSIRDQCTEQAKASRYEEKSCAVEHVNVAERKTETCGLSVTECFVRMAQENCRQRYVEDVRATGESIPDFLAHRTEAWVHEAIGGGSPQEAPW